MRNILGAILVGVGILALLYGVGSSGAQAGSTSLNLGLLVDKIVITLLGSTLSIMGTLIWLSADAAPKPNHPPDNR